MVATSVLSLILLVKANSNFQQCVSLIEENAIVTSTMSSVKVVTAEITTLDQLDFLKSLPCLEASEISQISAGTGVAGVTN
jgi:hypothetical protein